jgi:ubiquinone/menaquinone biosynthesis C-methylase UbiE
MTSIIETYSKLASAYESRENLESCWGRVTQHATGLLPKRQGNEVVVEVGCGPGIQLASLIETSDENITFIGVEPADNLRKNAIERTKRFPNAQVLNGTFENLPIESYSVDYLYSILAFHWVSDIRNAVLELSRILKKDGEMDLFFSGKHSGKEFAGKTAPINFKYMSPRQLMDAAVSQQRLTLEGIDSAFRPEFGSKDLTVSESYNTYYDSLEGHWSWRCRVEGLVGVPEETKAEYDLAVKAAIASLSTEKGIPYTVHLLHVKLRS